jgi:hypothetical protein
MARISKATSAKAPWWVGEGDEQCAHCGSFYVLELEFRCEQCDGPACPHCKMKHSAGHFVCPECVEENADG